MESMLPLEMTDIPLFAIGRQFAAWHKGNDRDSNRDYVHLRYIDRKINGFFARLRGIHQNDRYSVPG
jgi:hypothetical protein